MGNSPTSRFVIPPGKKVIFRSSKQDPKTGKVIFASWFGLRGFPILVDDDGK